MSFTRFITIYIVQGIVFVFFIFLAYQILKRDTKRLNLIFAGFYITISAGLFVNFIYGPITDLNTVYLLNFITNFLLFYAPIFLTIFSLILLKSEKVITAGKQYLILIVYGALLAVLIIFPWNNSEIGIMISTPQSSPWWSIPFFLYAVIVISVLCIIPNLVLSFQILKKFEDEQLKKKWKRYIIGLIFLYIFTYGLMISNMLNNATFRLGMGLISIILNLIGSFLVYKGVGQKID